MGVDGLLAERSTFRVRKDGTREAIHDERERPHRHVDLWIGLTCLRRRTLPAAGMLDPDICRRLMQGMSDALETKAQAPTGASIGHVAAGPDAESAGVSPSGMAAGPRWLQHAPDA
eukprot:15387795-Heterocapsa_arctica.AAC.1